jgi:5,10-methylenetetrahydrofolate reductase
MNENLFGVHIPEAIVARLDQASDQKTEGRRICTELLQELAQTRHVAGAHVMAPRQEAASAEAIADSGVRGRPRAR